MKLAILGVVTMAAALAVIGCSDDKVDADENGGGSGGGGGNGSQCMTGSFPLKAGSDERCPACQPTLARCEVADLACEYSGGWDAYCVCKVGEDAPGGGGAAGGGGEGGAGSLAWECAL